MCVLSVWQLYFVDGEMLVNNPVTVMEQLLEFLGVQGVDYDQLLKCVCAMPKNYHVLLSLVFFSFVLN